MAGSSPIVAHYRDTAILLCALRPRRIIPFQATMPTKLLRLIPEVHRATHRIGIYLDSLGISQGEGHILSQLAASGDSTIAELHRALAHQRSTLTSILDRLAERQFITRESDPNDRRSFVVRLTKKGRTVAARVHRGLSSIEELALKGVTNQQLKSTVKVLGTLESIAERASANKPK